MAELRSPCPEVVTRWVASASVDLEVDLEPQACHGPLLRLRVRPGDAVPLDVEVAEPPGPAFRRAGRLRVSPIVDVPDYGQLPAGQRRDFEALVRWLTRHENEVSFVPSARDGPLPRVSWIGLRRLGPWLLVAALLLCWIGRRRVPLPAAEALPVCAVFGAALALRWCLGIWGPHHINGQGPLWIRGALDSPEALSAYGPGYHEVYAWILALGGTAPDLLLFAVNAVLSSLVSVVIYLVARDLDIDPRRAALAAMLWAVDPIAVRFAATEGYFTVIVLLTLATSACLVAAVVGRSGTHEAAPPPDRLRTSSGKNCEKSLEEGVRGRNLSPERFLPRGLLALAGALLAAQAVRVHPVAWIPVALAPWLVLARGESGLRASRRIVMTLGAVLLTGAVVLLVSGQWIQVVSQGAVAHHVGGAAVGRFLPSVPWRALPCLTATAALAVWLARRRRLVAVALLGLAALLGTHGLYAQSDLWQASYQRLFAPVVLIALASQVPQRLLGWRVLVPTALALALLCTAVHWPLIASRTTEQQEYAFLRRALAEVPPGCRVAHVARAGLRVVEVPSHVLEPGSILRVELPEDLVAAFVPGQCFHYVHTSICTSAEGRTRCAAVEAWLEDRVEAARARFLAVPSYDRLGYDRPTVDVVIWRVSSIRNPP